ncbi:serine protease inhibitor 88Ea-like [Zophobas morio]|uniref:serine protease inhibitor 88Ea-like n=1 Tax=Zophobas morio TaxID=2755281 RepID=UPI00308337F5
MTTNFAFLLVLLYLNSSNQQCLTENDNQPPSATTSLYSGQHIFSFTLLNAINHHFPTENIFFSPYTTYRGLLLAYFLSNGQTEFELKNILALKSTQSKIDFFHAYQLDKLLTRLHKSNSSYELADVNKIYVSDDIAIRECVGTLFLDELQQISFKPDPENATVAINEWVKGQSHNLIKNILPQKSFNVNTTLALVNAAYFEGTWDRQFNRVETFYISPSSAKLVPMMYTEDYFNHEVSVDLQAHILEMPYEGTEISMYIILPPFTNYEDTLKRLNVENFKKMVASDRLLSKKVRVSLPKFSMEETIDLRPVFESLGASKLFKSGADFSVLSKEENVYFSNGFHKAKILVSEQGAAQSGRQNLVWRIGNDGDQVPAQFKCNRPFIFVIYKKSTHTILFIGMYRK